MISDITLIGLNLTEVKNQPFRAGTHLLGISQKNILWTSSRDLLILENLYAIQSVICNEIGLSAQSPADVALCKSRKREQPVSDIRAIFEVKMSIVWNWELKNNKLICLGDFRTHKGNPGLLLRYNVKSNW